VITRGAGTVHVDAKILSSVDRMNVVWLWMDYR